jgi:hypothetical protein
MGSIGQLLGSAQQPQHSKYGFRKTLDVPYSEALDKTRAAVKEEGFGVLSEIDIKDKLKEKLGVDFRNYVILGASIRLSRARLCRKKSTSDCSFPAMSSSMRLTKRENLCLRRSTPG